LVKGPPPDRRFLWSLLPCAAVLTLAAWLRGAEYDEQYTLFLTSGVPRPDWPDFVFSAGLARQIQSGSASLAGIAADLRLTDVHPPLYFWLVSLWRRVCGNDLFEARLLSVALGTGALGLTGEIARLSRIHPVRAMMLTLGCYGFTYTSVVARGFALAQLLVLGGVVCLLLGWRAKPRARTIGSWIDDRAASALPRSHAAARPTPHTHRSALRDAGIMHFALAGALFGAATLTNYLSVFAAGACLFTVFVWSRQREYGLVTSRSLLAAMFGLLLFIPGDLWWFLAQRGSRPGQFEPFSLSTSIARLTVRFVGNLLGGLPLYVERPAAPFVTAFLGALLLWLIARVVWRWRRIGVPHTRIMFGLAALAPPCGLLLLGFIFNNTPIEVRYLSFSTPFIGLLLAGALGRWEAAAMLTVQADHAARPRGRTRGCGVGGGWSRAAAKGK
jgi:hypothetical protein